MISALLHGKLDRWFTRPSAEIEDLLTSLVFDVCRFHKPQALLLPFIQQARTMEGLLLDLPSEVIEDVEYCFWDFHFGDADESENLGPVEAAQGEPELVLKLHRGDQPEAWILVEAKLLSGKSSEPSPPPNRVTDQLGKYWLHLKRRAHLAGAVPLAVIYLVRGITSPQKDFSDTQKELQEKGHEPAPLYWLSWRAFAATLEESELSPVMKDIQHLLSSRWGLAPARLRAWPIRPPTLSFQQPFNFREEWKWLNPNLPPSSAWTFR